MAEVIWDIMTRVGNSARNEVTWMADWTWEQGTWLADEIWNGITWMGEWICFGLKWTRSLFITENFLTDVVLEFYYGNLDSK